MNAMNVWATTALWYHSKHQIKVMWASFYSERVVQRGTVIKMWCGWTIKVLTKLDLTLLKCPHISYKIMRYRVCLVQRIHVDLATEGSQVRILSEPPAFVEKILGQVIINSSRWMLWYPIKWQFLCPTFDLRTSKTPWCLPFTINSGGFQR